MLVFKSAHFDWDLQMPCVGCVLHNVGIKSDETQKWQLSLRLFSILFYIFLVCRLPLISMDEVNVTILAY